MTLKWRSSSGTVKNEVYDIIAITSTSEVVAPAKVKSMGQIDMFEY